MVNQVGWHGMKNQNKNADLEYALKQGNFTDADAYRESLIQRINTPSANTGKILTQGDVNRELNRLGLKPIDGANIVPGDNISAKNVQGYNGSGAVGLNAPTNTGVDRNMVTERSNQMPSSSGAVSGSNIGSVENRNLGVKNNAELDYALKQGGYENNIFGKAKFVENMLGRIHTESADGSKILTEEDVYKELNRLGLSTKMVRDDNGVGLVVSDGDKFNQWYLMNGQGYQRGHGGGIMTLDGGKIAYFDNKGYGGVGSSLAEARLLTQAINSGSRNSAESQAYLAAKSKQEQVDAYLEEYADYKAALMQEVHQVARDARAKQRLAQRVMSDAMTVSGLKNTGAYDREMRQLEKDYNDTLAELELLMEDELEKVELAEEGIRAAAAKDINEIYQSAVNMTDDNQDMFLDGLQQADDDVTRLVEYVKNSSNDGEKLEKIYELVAMGAEGPLLQLIIEESV